MIPKVNLLNFNRQALKDYCASLGEAPFRATQLMQWIHQAGHTGFDQMTNVSKSLRQKLADCAEIKLPEVITEQKSADGTCKWLLKLDCGNCIETVFIPEKNRGTLCVSSQVGCALTCSFCSTAKQGFNRNLTVAEIIGQVWIAVRLLDAQRVSNNADDGYPSRSVTNVVMMGMGEPLLNFDNVVPAMDLMMDDFAYGLSKRRVTLSTSGVLPALEQLKQVSPVALAVSLHAPNDALRNELVPINRKYPLDQLMRVCKDYFKDEPRRMPTFEYVMLRDVNDRPEHARQLVQLLTKYEITAKINLIPFNPFPLTPYRCSTPEAIAAFRDYLMAKGFNAIVRKTRGDDIDAACGQLAGAVKDKTSRSQRWQKIQGVTREERAS